MSDGARKPRAARSPFQRVERVKAGDALGPDCPVRPLGHNKSVYYFTDPVGQVREMRAGEMTPNGLISLFLGDIGWLEKECPTESKRAKRGADRCTWHNPSAVQRLIAACRREGFFDPRTQTRGPGIWPFNATLMVGEEFAGSDQLIVHTGDRVGWVTYAQGVPSIEWGDAGRKLGEFVYPSSAPQPAPDDEGPSEDELTQCLAMFNRWHWVDGEGAAWLAFGWNGCAYVPACLPYRPTGYVQGGSGCGKSALLAYLQILQQDRPLKYDNATAARLREDFAARNEVRPIIINEAEVTDDNRRLAGLIEMARYVYTAGEGSYGRGGSHGSEVDIIASFMFAAIEPPPLLPQDANRIVMLRLGRLEVTPEQMEAFEQAMPSTARRLGPKLARRVIEVWPQFGPTLTLFRKGLIDAKHSPRSANTFGVLLAMAHLMRWGAVPDDSDVAEWVTKMDARLLATRDDNRTTEGLCLMHLLTFRLGPHRGGDLHPLGDYVRRALRVGFESNDAIGTLKRYGLTIADLAVDDGAKRRWLAVSNKHQGLEEIFRGTRWAGGAWVSALRMLEGARASPRPLWFGGAQDRATIIPAELFPSVPQDIDANQVEADAGP